jgi:hypothetical protein
MIELTTGLVFLMTSLYGNASTTTDSVNVQTLRANVGNTASVAASDRAIFEKYVRDHFADTPILAEIARCESTFRQFDKNGNVIRGLVDNDDIGLMQINERYHLDTAEKLGYDIHTLEGNMAYAKYLYGKSGSRPWNASKPCWEKTLAVK